MSKTDDLISRQAAIDELDKGAWGVEWDKSLAKAMLENLPSAQPEHKTGKWVRVSAEEYVTRASYVYRCNVCGGKSWYDSKYCPGCGSLMERNT